MECPSSQETPAKRRYTQMARRPIPDETPMGMGTYTWHILDEWGGSPICLRRGGDDVQEWELYEDIGSDRVCGHCWSRFSWREVAHDVEFVDLGYETPCKVWTRGTQGAGYGSRGLDGKNRLTHREAYEQENGPILAGYVLHHLCGQKRCLEPTHMVALSRADHCRLHRPGDHRVYG